MIRTHLSRLRLSRDFAAGQWQPALIDRARALWESSPTDKNLQLLIRVQHAIQGFSPAEIQRLIETVQQRRSGVASLYRLAALAREYQQPVELTLPPSRIVEQYPLLLSEPTDAEGMLKRSLKPHWAPDAGANELSAKLIQWDKFSTSLYGHSVAVVGNADTGVGQKLGNAIDQCDYVVRFNRINQDREFLADYGSKTDIWVVSPGFNTTGCKIHADTLMVSGVAPFDKPSKYWRRIAYLPVEQIVTFPSHIWYRLVRTLEAPPSAGLLMLAALVDDADKLTRVVTTGFTVSKPDRNNHYGDTDRRSNRHNWEREAIVAHTLITQLNESMTRRKGREPEEHYAASQKSS